MKILGVGLGRTGTASLTTALQLLGLKCIHNDVERLNDILLGTNSSPNFRRYDDVDAVTDVPTAYFFEEFLKAYPGLKCVLTLRNEDDWWRSIATHFRRIPIASEQENPVRWRIRHYIFGSAKPYEFLYKKKFREHNARVLACVPKNQLLVMDITQGDGWEKLCGFLGIPVPQNVDFPVENLTPRNLLAD